MKDAKRDVYGGVWLVFGITGRFQSQNYLGLGLFFVVYRLGDGGS